MLTGRCMCGAVEYQVADRFRYAMNCHCSQCRRTTGAAFKPLAGIERDQIAIVRGADRIVRYGEADGHDAHCGTCFSMLFSVVRGGAYVHVAMGSLVDPPSIRPSMHIFVGSKASWYAITDNLPQFDAFPKADT